MTIEPERLAAFADGELDAGDAAMVAAAVAADPALAAQISAHRALRARLSAHYAPILDEPLPQHLIPPVERSDGTASLNAARARREAKRSLWSRPIWPIGGAIAAMLVLGVAIGSGSFQGGGNGLDATLVAALDSQPSGATSGDTRVLLSFVDGDDRYCRVYAQREVSGIACRSAHGWQPEWQGDGDTSATGELRQATSSEAFARGQEMAKGEALDADTEAAAIARHWSD